MSHLDPPMRAVLETLEQTALLSNQTLSSRGENRTYTNERDGPSGCGNSYELVMIALTLPLWTFATLYAILFIIQYLRRLQHFSIYDKCTWHNAHFRYDFHLVLGKHSANYSRHESYIILDLLDSQHVSTLTIQIPGTSLFNDQHVFLYQHSRNDLRCVTFTIYRRHPIKDIKCIRIAHTCNNAESRLFIYGLQLHDHTNSENRFFPIQSVVKNRGTQWALNTTFEPKIETNFKRLGADCYDPFGYSFWPTYLEVLTILLYIWCATYCFGHLMSVGEIFGNIPVHALTIFFITGTSAAALCFIHLRFIKSHIVDSYYDSCWARMVQIFSISVIIIVSLSFWTMALGEARRCYRDSIEWLASTVTCATALTLLVVITWFAACCYRKRKDQKILAETDIQLLKTNSRENITFASDPKPGFCISLCTRQQSSGSGSSSARDGPPKNWNALGPQSDSQKMCQSKKKGKSHERHSKQQEGTSSTKSAASTATTKEADETLDTAFGVGSKYIKARNRNSISQYV